MAVRRDRPGVYDDYYIEDLLNLPLDARRRIGAKGLNYLVISGALGFGDIPASAFAEGYNLIAVDGWIAFNIKKDFIEESDSTGFSNLVRGMLEGGIFDLRVRHRYYQRLSVDGRPARNLLQRLDEIKIAKPLYVVVGSTWRPAIRGRQRSVPVSYP